MSTWVMLPGGHLAMCGDMCGCYSWRVGCRSAPTVPGDPSSSSSPAPGVRPAGETPGPKRSRDLGGRPGRSCHGQHAAKPPLRPRSSGGLGDRGTKGLSGPDCALSVQLQVILAEIDGGWAIFFSPPVSGFG